MKNYWLIIFILNLIGNLVDCQWKEVTNIPVAQYLNCIDAIRDDFAVIGSASPGKIFITSDAGNTWTSKLIPYDSPIDISLVNKTTYYAALGNGMIIRTTDSGDNWEILYNNPQKTGFANYIEMFSATEGIAMCDGFPFIGIPVFLKTTDGINWVETCNQVLGGGASEAWLGVDFVDPLVGYYSPKGGPSPRKLCKTTDGGYNWTELDFSVYANVLKFFTKDYGLLIKVPTVYVTFDGGINWETYVFVNTNNYNATDIEFVPDKPEIIWAGSGQGLAVSVDSGKTWQKHSEQLITKAFDISFTNKYVGWIIGTDGKVFYTNNCGGLITDVKQNDILPNEIKLQQNYPNPFNPTTTIEFSIPKSGNVKLKVYDLLGNELITLVNENKEAGNHKVIFDGSKLSCGVYFYIMQFGERIISRKMLFIK